MIIMVLMRYAFVNFNFNVALSGLGELALVGL